MRLVDLGWDAAWQEAFAPWAGRADHQPGRVGIEFNHIFRVYLNEQEVDATASGRLKHHALRRSELPAVGDWVAVRKRPHEERAAIVAVLPRRSYFSRRAAGNVTDEQIVAANVDVVFAVMGLDGDFNVRRLERYLLLARESGARPVVLLTKPDLAPDVIAQERAVHDAAGGVPVHVISPKFRTGLERVSEHLGPAHTAALLGSSGVGKSTIINSLVGDEIRQTAEVREHDSRGRHTTIHRELVALPGGGLLIDTPGMRELQLWDVDQAVHETFDDIHALAAACRFTDCRHRDEPRCAVKAAVAEGHIPEARLESYLKLQDELAYLTRQQDERALIDEKRRAREGSKALRAHLKKKRG